jgi:hypothetical protein
MLPKLLSFAILGLGALIALSIVLGSADGVGITQLLLAAGVAVASWSLASAIRKSASRSSSPEAKASARKTQRQVVYGVLFGAVVLPLVLVWVLFTVLAP